MSNRSFKGTWVSGGSVLTTRIARCESDDVDPSGSRAHAASMLGRLPTGQEPKTVGGNIA